jgi:ABC-type transport system substrate-binding protein
MMLALNRDKIVQVLYSGDGKFVPAFGWPFVLDKAPGPAELGPWWRYDLAEAKKLVQAAGADGMSFEFWKSNAIASPDTTTALYAPDLLQIGITLKNVDMDSTSFSGQFYGRQFASNPKAEASHCYWSQQPPTANGYFYDNVHSKSGKNLFAVNDPQIDSWAEQQRGETNPQARKEILRKIWDQELAKAYWIEFSAAFGLSAYQPWVRWYRFVVPYGGTYTYFDFGMHFDKAWVDR